jgi:hypothetical protein
MEFGSVAKVSKENTASIFRAISSSPFETPAIHLTSSDSPILTTTHRETPKEIIMMYFPDSSD